MINTSNCSVLNQTCFQTKQTVFIVGQNPDIQQITQPTYFSLLIYSKSSLSIMYFILFMVGTLGICCSQKQHNQNVLQYQKNFNYPFDYQKRVKVEVADADNSINLGD